jgi:hypothetical protein
MPPVLAKKDPVHLRHVGGASLPESYAERTALLAGCGKSW